MVTHEDENNAKIDLGTSVEVNGVRFNIMYDGMQRYCFLCLKKHGTECPAKVRFEFLRNLRKGKTGKTKIYSDSSLRHANQLALTTNIACMSGGGIGELCNVIKHDEKHENIILHAGNNEITRTESLPEFAYTIEKAGILF